MVIPFKELKHYDFHFGNIDAMPLKAKSIRWQVQSRSKTAILYILRGSCRFASADGEVSAEEGELLYLPKGSVYSALVTADAMEHYLINFEITVEGEEVLFSRQPVKLADHISSDCLEAIQTLVETGYSEKNTVVKYTMLCTIFLSLQHSNENPRRLRLSPAVQRIREQIMQEPITEHFCAPELASLCNLSTAQFYHLFHREYGMTPLEYSDRLLMRKAEMLLETQQYTVTEIASMLGFENPAYFSRFFKKHKGVPPSAFLPR